MTLVGALLSIFTGAALVAVFSSALVSDGTSPTYAFAIGATVGTAAWVGLATRLGLPVSTTHALTGSVVLSAALVFGPEAVRWPVLAGAVLLPLLVSPLLGVVFGGLLVTTTRRIPSGGDRALAAVHWASSGLTAMARAMNDAPKLVALGALLWLAADGRSFGLGASVGVGVMVACAMALGSYLGGRRVTDTLAHRLTRMNHREGTAANVATAALVTLAATNGLPVSTTQVAGGSIAGIGLAARDGRTSHSVVREIALAWLVTAPGAGLIAATAAWLAGAL